MAGSVPEPSPKLAGIVSEPTPEMAYSLPEVLGSVPKSTRSMNNCLAVAGRVAKAGVPAVFLAIFFAYPVGSILWAGLADSGLAPLWDLLNSARARNLIWFTFWQAFASAGLTLLIAMPTAAVVARCSQRVARWVRALVTVPFMLPTVVVAGAFENLFVRFGLDDDGIRLRHTFWALLIAHAFFNFAVVVRIVGSHWQGLDYRLEEQARVLGARPLQIFWAVTLPRLRPALMTAGIITYLFSFTSFGVVLLLGGPRLATIETEIYRQAITRTDLQTAAALGLLQIVAVISLVVIAGRFERRHATAIAYPTPRPMHKGFVLFNLGLAGIFLGGPIGLLVHRSFLVGDRYGLDNYLALTKRVTLLPASAASAIFNSLVFACIATAIAVVVGGLASLVVVHGRRGIRRLFDLGLTIPLGVSGVTIGFGILIALDEPPLDLRTSWLIVPIAHCLVGIPFVLRTMVGALSAIDPTLREAASVLGAAPRKVHRFVDLPIAWRALLVGAGFAFAVSMGEFGATSFLPRSADNLTAPLALFRLLATPGELLRGQAMALAVVLMVVVALFVAAIESIRKDNPSFL